MDATTPSFTQASAAGTSARPAATPAPEASSRKELNSDFETFLKMLTVQMENQDPLDPVKSEDFAVQLATFSGVEQQVQTNELLKSLATQMSVSGMAEFAGWVGMEARAAAPALFDGTPIALTPKPQATADSAALVVRDAGGTIVQRVPIPVAEKPMEWTGILQDGSTLPDGTYSFDVESYSGGSVVANSPAEVYARIVEARAEGGTTQLILEGGTAIDAADVSALRQPAA